MKKRIKTPEEVRKEREHEYGVMEKGASVETWPMKHKPYYVDEGEEHGLGDQRL